MKTVECKKLNVVRSLTHCVVAICNRNRRYVWRGTLHLFCEGSLFEKSKVWTAWRTTLSGAVEQGEVMGRRLQLFMKAHPVIFSRGHQTAVESQSVIKNSILLIMRVEFDYQSVPNTCQI